MMDKLGSRTQKALAWGLFFAGTCLVAGAAYASGDGGHAAGHGGWTNTDWWRVLNFTILAAVLVWVFRKAGTPALNNRIETIKEELADLEGRKESAKAELAETEARLARLEEEAKAVIEDYVAQGEAAKAKIIEEAKKAAGRLEDQAQRHMEHELKEAKKRLQEDILGRAVEMGEKLIRDNINESDQDRLVNEYLDKVVAQ